MSRGKPSKAYNFGQRMYQNMKNNSKYLVIGVIFIIAGYLSFNFFSLPQVMVLDVDRAENYKVKVLPASLEDHDLNKLAKDTFSFLAMIDAGSSGCRAHVYRYGKLGTISGPLYVLPQHDSKKVKPGLSSFAEHPQDAGASLQGLIDFMKEQVPEKDWAVTPIWLKATAGLRMLEPAKSEAVLESVRTFLGNKANSPFLFRPSFAKIIPGNEEGGFGWIAYNYLKRIIGPKRTPNSLETPYAVVEMGGASSQVSQLAPNAAAAAKIPEQYRFTFTIEGETYQLYTHSYLGFGAEQGREKLNKALSEANKAAASANADPVKEPCLYSGYSRSVTDPITEPYQGPAGLAIIGGENPTEEVCVASLGQLFKSIYNAAAVLVGVPSATLAPATANPHPECDPRTQPGPYSFNCIYQPEFVLDSANFLVFENFYYMASGLGVKSVAALSQVLNGTVSPFPLRTTPAHIKEATNKACDTDWATLQKTYPLDNQPKDVNLKMCFSGSYAYSFLVHGLKVDKDKVLTIQKEVGPSEIEWALGAAYKEAADLLKRTNLRPV